MSTVNMQIVKFHEDELQAVEDNGKVWVSIKRVCEILKIDYSGQLVKLKEKPWSTMESISIVAEDGRMRTLSCLDLESMPIWLATIDSRKVSRDSRPKLEIFQRECAKVLRDHFFGKKEETPTTSIPRDPTSVDFIFYVFARASVLPAELRADFLRSCKEQCPSIYTNDQDTPVTNVSCVNNEIKDTVHPILQNLHLTDFKDRIPTELGKIVGKKPTEINFMLLDAGLQFKDGQEWRLTEKGFQFGRETVIKLSNGLFHKIHWSTNVLREIIK